MTRRVVITGLGTVNSLCSDVPGFWAGPAAPAGAASASSSSSTPPPSRSTSAARSRTSSPRPSSSRKTAARLDRFAQFAVVAAIAAVKDSGLDFAQGRPVPLRRHHRQRHRRPQRIRGAARPLPRRRARPDQPVRHPEDDPQRGRRQHLHPLRPVRPQHRRLDGLCLGRQRHRRRPARHPARPRRRDDHRRLGGGHHADGPGRLHLRPRPVAPQRRSRKARAGRSTRTATASS